MDYLFRKQFSFPFENGIRGIVRSFGTKGKIVLACFVILFVGSSLSMAKAVSEAFTVSVPAYGGTLREGVIGLPQFINPVLSVSGPSQDLTSLIYSGLTKKTPEGTFVPDLAESYTVSSDFKTYTFILRDGVTFHDGKPVTADDVIFTLSRATDPALKSPKRANWEGVTVQKINQQTIQFSLKQPYPFFLENATMGILPKHIWSGVSNEEFTFSNYNRNPIGSGPYKISNISTNSGGIPLSYNLSAFKEHAGGPAFISHITMKFYSNEDDLLTAYEAGDVDSLNSISPEAAARLGTNGARVERITLPRIFGVFFNTTKNPALKEKEVRQALSDSLNKQTLIDTILHGFGEQASGPLPKEFGGDNTEIKTGTTSPLSKATQTLESHGWKKNEKGVSIKKINKESVTLSLSLSTSDVPELKAMAEAIAKSWRELGAEVDLKVFEMGDLNQNVIRPRNYEALLFGQVINHDTDLFAFWHSSERADPGLNISLYTNGTVDKLLEEARTLLDPDERLIDYKKVETEIKKDVPAVFIYSPEFLYVLPPDVQGIKRPAINDSKDRFIGIEQWYIETDGVWKLFAQ